MADRPTRYGVTLAQHLANDLARLTPDYIDALMTRVERTLTHGYPTTTPGANPSTGPSNPDPLPTTLTEAAVLARLKGTEWLDELNRRLEHALSTIRWALDHTLTAPGADRLTDADWRATRCQRCDLEALTSSAGPLLFETTTGQARLCQRHHDEEFTCDMPGCTNRCRKGPNGRPKLHTVTGTLMRLCAHHYETTRDRSTP